MPHGVIPQLSCEPREIVRRLSSIGANMTEENHRNELTSGRTFMIAALIGYVIVAAAGKVLGNLSFVISLATVLASVIGALKISSGLEYSGTSKVVYAICMFIPIVGFVYIIVLIFRANKALALQD